MDNRLDFAMRWMIGLLSSAFIVYVASKTSFRTTHSVNRDYISSINLSENLVDELITPVPTTSFEHAKKNALRKRIKRMPEPPTDSGVPISSEDYFAKSPPDPSLDKTADPEIEDSRSHLSEKNRNGRLENTTCPL